MTNYTRVIKKLALTGALLIVFVPGAYGLGFGKLEVSSGLGEPFQGRIDLTSLYAGDSTGLEVSLASPKDFDLAGVKRTDVLERLVFEIINDGANPYIKVTSPGPIHEPFMHFMVALRWQGGKLVRNYTALLDPPRYARGSGSTPTPAIESTSDTAEIAEAVPQPAPAAVQPIQAVENVSVADSANNIESSEIESSEEISLALPDEAIEVKRGQSLWRIADRIRTGGISIHQMMLAIFDENPNAFIRGDINMIKAGAILTVPDQTTVSGIDNRWAVVEFERLAFGGSPEILIAQQDVTAPAQPETPLPIQPETMVGTANNRSENIELTNYSEIDDLQPSETATENLTGLGDTGGELIQESENPVRTTSDPDTSASQSIGEEALIAEQREIERIAAANAQLAVSAANNATVNNEVTPNNENSIALLTQEVSLLEYTLTQANSENELLKERINLLEDKVDFATRFIEFERIAQSITESTESNNAASDSSAEAAGGMQVDGQVSVATSDTAIEDTSAIEGTAIDTLATDIGKTQTEELASVNDDSQSVIEKGILAATQELESSLDQAAENIPAEESVESSDDTVIPGSSEVASRWVQIQDAVATRFNNLSSKFASAQTDSMQPILAMIAVVILALGALMAIFRHRQIAGIPAESKSSSHLKQRKTRNISEKTSRSAYQKVSIPAPIGKTSDNDESTVIMKNIQAKTSTAVEEAEVYMALGHDDSAEETLKDAIKSGSVDTDASMKLLEIYQKKNPPTVEKAPANTLRPRIEEPEQKLPMEQLSTAPSESGSGQGIPMFGDDNDGLTPSERDALRDAVMSAEIDTKPDDKPVVSDKVDRRSRLLRAAQGTKYTAKSSANASDTDKDEKIKDLELKLDRLQGQMDELLRRLSQDDDSDQHSGAA